MQDYRSILGLEVCIRNAVVFPFELHTISVHSGQVSGVGITCSLSGFHSDGWPSELIGELSVRLSAAHSGSQGITQGTHPSREHKATQGSTSVVSITTSNGGTQTLRGYVKCSTLGAYYHRLVHQFEALTCPTHQRNVTQRVNTSAQDTRTQLSPKASISRLSVTLIVLVGKLNERVKVLWGTTSYHVDVRRVLHLSANALKLLRRPNGRVPFSRRNSVDENIVTIVEASSTSGNSKE